MWQLQAGRITAVACVFATAFLLTLGFGEAWVREDAKPSIRLLGSGSHLSLLITSDQARVLIANGDDATAFGNALGGSRHLTSRRIDVVILVGNNDDIPVARYVRKNIDARRVFVLDGPLVALLGDLGLEHDQVIAKPTRLRLPGGIDLTITPESVADGSWSAEIVRGQTTVVAGNSPELDDLDKSGASLLIFTNDLNLDALTGIHARAIALPARAAKPTELKTAANDLEHSLLAIRVESAATEPLSFVKGGIQVDGQALRLAADTSS